MISASDGLLFLGNAGGIPAFAHAKGDREFLAPMHTSDKYSIFSVRYIFGDRLFVDDNDRYTKRYPSPASDVL
jgi:hypothetical protein